MKLLLLYGCLIQKIIRVRELMNHGDVLHKIKLNGMKKDLKI